MKDRGVQMAAQAAKITLATDPSAYVKEQQAAYEEIDKLRQQDLLNETQAAMAKAKVDQQINAERLSFAQDFFGQLATLSTSSNKELAAIGKAAAMAQAGIDGVLAIQKALASYPPPLNFVMAAAVGVATAANIAKIAGFADGGVDIRGPGTGTSDSILARLSAGESVVTASATSKNRNTLAAMNAGAGFDGGNGSGGVTINVVHDGSTNVQAARMSDGTIRIIARQEIAAARPSLISDAVGTSVKIMPDLVAAANRNPRKRA